VLLVIAAGAVAVLLAFIISVKMRAFVALVLVSTIIAVATGIPLALGVAALFMGLAIIFLVTRKFGGSMLLYALPNAGLFAAMHAIVPPHTGPVTAASGRTSRRRLERGPSSRPPWASRYLPWPHGFGW